MFTAKSYDRARRKRYRLTDDIKLREDVLTLLGDIRFILARDDMIDILSGDMRTSLTTRLDHVLIKMKGKP